MVGFFQEIADDSIFLNDLAQIRIKIGTYWNSWILRMYRLDQVASP